MSKVGVLLYVVVYYIDFRVCDFAFAFKTQNAPCVSRFKRVLLWLYVLYLPILGSVKYLHLCVNNLALFTNDWIRPFVILGYYFDIFIGYIFCLNRK